MDIHHITSTWDILSNCPYCFIDVSKKVWTSQFHASIHYKTFHCSCGKKLSVKAPFEGSGHDSWKQKEPFSQKEEKKDIRINSIDDKVEIIERKGNHS